MGMFQQKDTHGKRSSSMSFALRWKHENLRLIVLSAIISIAMTFMLLVLLYGTAYKNVSVVLNGQETVVSTKQWVLQRLLDEQAITVGEHDKISMPLDSDIKDGDRIVIDQAIPITVKADGKANTFYTTEKTVKAAIGEFNISLSDEDKIQPALNAQLNPDMIVSIIRVDKQVDKAERKVPFEVVKKDDPTLEEGKQKVVQTGKEGLLVEHYEKVYEDGNLVSKKLVTKTVETKSVDKVIAVGTKKKEPEVKVASYSPVSSGGAQSITKAGVTFNAKKVLKSVTLTAYSAGVASTGKSSSHPEYGVTASGAKVEEGRTIAVDPDVIPMGWWVYIEGVGFRRAEDTGGAIKGSKIDVYFDSESYVKKFGRKKGHTVYVIGPNKPKAS
ncbi:3D domain-containing protein [Paenibacillus pinihumi]|uniref:3D domain-containing protein n=1 Tax=Paenibacillus pinihumi TaxID=669462 RepID=UPI0004007BB6|nr:3D domain-containing protein [Paenibacillus pinihumi]